MVKIGPISKMVQEFVTALIVVFTIYGESQEWLSVADVDRQRRD